MDKITEQSQEMWDNYRFGHFKTNIYQGKREELLTNFLSMVGKNDTLFDIGCGSGYWIEKCLSYGISKDQITGVDLSPTNVEILKRKGYKAICGSVTKLELEDNISDFTVCNGVVNVTSDPFLAFKELVRITKPSGYIFLNVTNRFNPYYYIIYKAAYPIRYIYWNWSKSIIDYIYPISKIFFQPFAYLIYKKVLDDQTGKTILMDGVMAPRMALFSKSKLRSYAKRCNTEIIIFDYNRYYLSLASIMKVN